MPIDYTKLSDDALKQMANGNVDYSKLSDDDLKQIATQSAGDNPGNSEDAGGGVLDTVGDAYQYVAGLGRSAVFNSRLGRYARAASGDPAALGSQKEDIESAFKGDAPTTADMIRRTGRGDGTTETVGAIGDAILNPVNIAPFQTGLRALPYVAKPALAVGKHLPYVGKFIRGGEIAGKALSTVNKGLKSAAPAAKAATAAGNTVTQSPVPNIIKATVSGGGKRVFDGMEATAKHIDPFTKQTEILNRAILRRLSK